MIVSYFCDMLHNWGPRIAGCFGLLLLFKPLLRARNAVRSNEGRASLVNNAGFVQASDRCRNGESFRFLLSTCVTLFQDANRIDGGVYLLDLSLGTLRNDIVDASSTKFRPPIKLYRQCSRPAGRQSPYIKQTRNRPSLRVLPSPSNHFTFFLSR